MAKKEQELTASMIDTFREFKETKNIDRTTLVSVLEESFRNVLAKIFGSDENFDVIVNPDKGDFEIYRNRIVVADGEVEDENKEITLSEARKIEPDYEVGEDVSETVDFNKFGRRAILTLRQTLASKILELEHDSLYNKYKDRVGQVISGEVYQVWKREVLIVDDENNELMLPKTEQIPGDTYRKGETVRAVILRVDNENNNPKIILSRTAPIFLQRLLEAEVPEIADGLIAIRRIARLPGERAKIAVETFDERIYPVGAWDVNEAYIVSFGGTFGNHISKGQEFLPLITSEEQLFRVTDAAIQFFDDYANPGERFKFTIDRVGAEKLQEVLKGAYNG